MLDSRLTEWESHDYYQLQLNPDFQRGHVWTVYQQVAYVEYFLRGGRSGCVIYFNKPSWMGRHNPKPGEYDDFVCVDGLQRLTALRRFLRDEIPVFGHLCSQIEGRMRMCGAVDNLVFNVNSLKTRAEVLQWYIQMNAGGTVHTKQEIDRVRVMLEDAKLKTSHNEI